MRRRPDRKKNLSSKDRGFREVTRRDVIAATTRVSALAIVPHSIIRDVFVRDDRASCRENNIYMYIYIQAYIYFSFRAHGPA